MLKLASFFGRIALKALLSPVMASLLMRWEVGGLFFR